MKRLLIIACCFIVGTQATTFINRTPYDLKISTKVHQEGPCGGGGRLSPFLTSTSQQQPAKLKPQSFYQKKNSFALEKGAKKSFSLVIMDTTQPMGTACVELLQGLSVKNVDGFEKPAKLQLPNEAGPTITYTIFIDNGEFKYKKMKVVGRPLFAK